MYFSFYLLHSALNDTRDFILRIFCCLLKAKATLRTPVYRTQEEYYDEVIALKKVRNYSLIYIKTLFYTFQTLMHFLRSGFCIHRFVLQCSDQKIIKASCIQNKEIGIVFDVIILYIFVSTISDFVYRKSRN